MALHYSFARPGGSSNLMIPTTDIRDPGLTDNVSVKSPEWMVQIDDALSSFVTGFETYAELFGWYGKSSRHTTGDIGNLLHTSATLRHSDVAIIIPNGAYATALEVKMNLGNMLKEVLIVRLGNIENLKIPQQQISFKGCRIQSFEQQLDRLIIIFNVTSKQNTVFAFGQDGTAAGQTVSQVDYSQNTAAAG
jgi:hypothetical protein